MCGLREVWQAACSLPDFKTSADTVSREAVVLTAQIICSTLSHKEKLQHRDIVVLLRAFNKLGLHPDDCRPGLSDALTAATLVDCSQSEAVRISELLSQWAIPEKAALDTAAVYSLVDRLTQDNLHSLKSLSVCRILSAFRKIAFQQHPCNLIDNLLVQLERSFHKSYPCTSPVLSSVMSSLVVLSHAPSNSQGEVCLEYFKESLAAVARHLRLTFPK